MVGTRKGQDVHGNTVGLEAAKIRQLKKLGDYKIIHDFSKFAASQLLSICVIELDPSDISGYTPIVIPHTVSSSVKGVHRNLAKLLKSENVVLPNLDDGYREEKRKF